MLQLPLLKEFLFAAILLYLGLVAILFFKQRAFIYHPDQSLPDLRLASWAEVIEVETEDGLTLRAWWGQGVQERPVILYFHGNGGNISGRAEKAKTYIDNGYSVLLAEYRGYGGNPGKPSEQGFYKDGNAYLDWLKNEKNILPDQIIYYGESLGSGPATDLASKNTGKALILEVPFLSVLDVAQSRYFFVPIIHLILKDQFRNDQKIADVNMPVLVGLAQGDEVIPIHSGQQLYDLANEPKKLNIYSTTHNFMHEAGFSNDALQYIQSLSLQ